MGEIYSYSDDGITGFAGAQSFVFALLAVLIGSAIVSIIKAKSSRNNYFIRGIAYFLVTASIFSGLFLSYRCYEFYELSQAYNGQKERETEKITGCVQSFSEEINSTDHNSSVDAFEVSGRRLSIQSSPWERGYHETLYEGGPIKNGSHVMIWRYRDQIVRIALLPGSC